jgi:hypothetical protein
VVHARDLIEMQMRHGMPPFSGGASTTASSPHPESGTSTRNLNDRIRSSLNAAEPSACQRSAGQRLIAFPVCKPRWAARPAHWLTSPQVIEMANYRGRGFRTRGLGKGPVL